MMTLPLKEVLFIVTLKVFATLSNDLIPSQGPAVPPSIIQQAKPNVCMESVDKLPRTQPLATVK